MLKFKIVCDLNQNTIQKLKDIDQLTTLKSYFQKAIEFTFDKVTFGWNEEQFFYPIKGDYNVLGHIIPIQEYSWEKLTKYIIKSVTQITLYFDDDSVIDSGDYYFENIKVQRFIDYNSTISYLEKQKYVTIKYSENPFLTDNRSFMFNKDTFLKNTIINNEYYNEWWNVDLLGTSLSSELSSIIVQLYDYSIK